MLLRPFDPYIRLTRGPRFTYPPYEVTMLGTGDVFFRGAKRLRRSRIAPTELGEIVHAFEEGGFFALPAVIPTADPDDPKVQLVFRSRARSHAVRVGEVGVVVDREENWCLEAQLELVAVFLDGIAIQCGFLSPSGRI